MRVLILLWLALIAWSGVAGAQIAPAQKKNHLPVAQLTALQSGEHQDVIVVFKHETASAEADQQRRARGLAHDDQTITERKAQRFEVIKRRALARQSRSDVEERKAYSHLPMSHVRVRNAAALERLVNDAEVEAVYPDEAHTFSLAESLPAIHQPQAAASGKTGAGTAVAVLDTGADYTQADLGSCTSPGVPAGCRVVYAQDFAPGDGQLDASGHGTNVASIVARTAPGTKIIALDVFNGLSAYTSDIVSAINWVIANKATYNVVAVNLSLGGGAYTAPVTQSSFYAPFTNLRAAGIIPVVASGNNAYVDRISSPAAVVGAVSVGAVYDGDIGGWGFGVCTDYTSAADKVTCFSNSASFLTMLAPGANISAGGRTYFGTSQATPHVAGAVAVLRSAFPADTVQQTITKLQIGPPVLDTRNGISTPRLDFGTIFAVDTQAPTAPSGFTATLTATTLVTLTWQAAIDNTAVTQYRIYRGLYPPVLIANLGIALTYLDSGLAYGTRYDYAVSACDALNNCSPLSSTASVTTGLPSFPGAPTGVSAVAGNAQAVVSFSVPATNGGATITGYTVTSSPGGFTATGASSPITVSGLINGVAYTFAVQAINSAGLGPASAPSAAVLPMAAPTATSLGSSRSPVTYGASVTFTATVAGFNPSGTITFSDGSSTLGMAALSGGVATFTSGNLGVGAHNIAAMYSGDASNDASTSNTLVQVVNAGGAGATPGTLAGGASHTCAVVSGGAQCWGYNGHGQLGDGTYVDRLAPVSAIPAGSGVTSVTAGTYHSCAVASGGVRCWGIAGEGRLGNGQASGWSTTPVTALLAGSGATRVVAGGTASGLGHTCAIVNGGVQCWGENSSGQVGNNSTTNSLVPVTTIAAGSGVTELAAGGQHVCAVMAGGLECWGENGYGQLGTGGTTNSLVPVSIFPAGSGVTAVAAGYGHTCVVINSGVQCWGEAGWGQLGNGSYTNSLTPVVALPSGSGATAIAARWGHTCVVAADELKCWGANPFGQLGYFTNSARRSASPLLVTVFANGNAVLDVAAGQSHTCIRGVGGAVQCWGLNNSGQLGNGSNTSSTAPVTVGFAAPPLPTPSVGLASSLNPATAGNAVAFTATLSGGASPTGVVTFKDGAATLGIAAVSGSIATLTTSALTAGAHSVEAVYGGDANNLASTSGVLVQTINPAQAATSTSLNVTPGGAVSYGTSLTLTGSISGGNSPTGSIMFRDAAATFFGIGGLSGNSASLGVNTFAPGTYSLTATYSGDTNNSASSSGAVVVNVVKASPAVNLFVPVNPAQAGKVVSLSATVTGAGGAFPSGTVTFRDGNTVLGNGTISTGSVFLGVNGLATGSHSITAAYSGDANYNPATSSAVVLTINAASSGTAVRADLNGDGKADILWRNTTTGDTYYYLMNGMTIVSEGYGQNVPTNWTVVGMGDLDGDGKADILWRNTATGDTYYYLMNGMTITGEGYGRNVPTNWTVAGMGDLDGDGKADILWRNTATGDTYYYLMNGMAIIGEGYGRNVPTNWQVSP